MRTFLITLLSPVAISVFGGCLTYLYFYYQKSQSKFTLAVLVGGIIAVIQMLIVWTCWMVLGLY